MLAEMRKRRQQGKESSAKSLRKPRCTSLFLPPKMSPVSKDYALHGPPGAVFPCQLSAKGLC